MNQASKLIPIAVLLLAGFSKALMGQSANENWYDKAATWNGFRQYHFKIADRPAYIVEPASAAEGKPWIWRARFPGYHAEMDIELVKRGFHLGYVDVAGLFGSPAAIAIADAFYEFTTQKRGLSSKACLEGVSRGGLLVYNWAAGNADKVASIYCDTPVCDIKSWPAGMFAGIGSDAAWKSCLEAYEFSEEQAKQFRGNPIDHAKIIANARIPLLHIVSENDRVVPPKENTYLLKQRIEQHGHEMEVISVAEGTAKSNGHHFTHPATERVVEFFLKNGAPGRPSRGAHQE